MPDVYDILGTTTRFLRNTHYQSSSVRDGMIVSATANGDVRSRVLPRENVVYETYRSLAEGWQDFDMLVNILSPSMTRY